MPACPRCPFANQPLCAHRKTLDPPALLPAPLRRRRHPSLGPTLQSSTLKTSSPNANACRLAPARRLFNWHTPLHVASCSTILQQLTSQLCCQSHHAKSTRCPTLLLYHRSFPQQHSQQAALSHPTHRQGGRQMHLPPPLPSVLSSTSRR